jgi:hypothetical protein
MTNIESNNQAVMHNNNIMPLVNIMNIVKQDLNTRNLEYLTFQNITGQDAGRIVLDVQTRDQKTGKIYVVHVDFMQTAPGVYQFLDCVYGSGSASDLKYLIYDSSPMVDDEMTHAKFYFVTRMINKCNAVGIPFKIIDYQNMLEESDLVDHLSKENPETVKQYIESGPLPAKSDILRMAFWAILYNTNSENIYSELHQLHSDRSSEINISGNLCVFVKWTDEGIYYVIADTHGSAFISWLWEGRSRHMGNYADSTMSTYRDGVNSFIYCQVNQMAIQKMQEMNWMNMMSLGAELHNGAYRMTSLVRDALRQYEIETRQVKDHSVS